jgi:Leucine-rich repeat (LRR) protein
MARSSWVCGLRELNLRLSSGQQPITHLDLSNANLLCVNLMCAKLGETCACRLASVLEQCASSPHCGMCLTHLSLEGNRLRALPNALFSFKNLQELHLGNNEWEERDNKLMSRLKVELPRLKTVNLT